MTSVIERRLLRVERRTEALWLDLTRRFQLNCVHCYNSSAEIRRIRHAARAGKLCDPDRCDPGCDPNEECRPGYPGTECSPRN